MTGQQLRRRKGWRMRRAAWRFLNQPPRCSAPSSLLCIILRPIDFNSFAELDTQQQARKQESKQTSKQANKQPDSHTNSIFEQQEYNFFNN